METLLKKAGQYIPEEQLDLIANAYEFAKAAHKGQTRRSGEPFIEHPLQTAIYLAELKLDSKAIAAALLHDVMEDCDVSYDQLENKFGLEVANLVSGVTKLTQKEALIDENAVFLTDFEEMSVDHSDQSPKSIDRDSSYESETYSEKERARIENLKKLLMSMAEDIRVVLIKLADRLHNMRTLKALPKHRRISIAQETLDIYAPLAHRLGIWEIKWRLEDLAFQHLNPNDYKKISKMLRSKRTAREDYIDEIRSRLTQSLKEAGIDGVVTGRPKHIYSIYKKIQRYQYQNMTIRDIYDLFALRIIVNRVNDCYSALGVVHSLWRPLRDQFDDYIGNPKDNLYQSIHTAVLCKGAFPVEVQIRTTEMHELAEYGVAAHWLYKEGSDSDPQFDKKMIWIRQLLDWQRDVSGAEDLIESFKTDIFDNQVYVYTPKGDLKELPIGSTPLDFAYQIHTDIGHQCVGAHINGKLVSLQYKLKNGDSIEIITSKTERGPSIDWLNPNLEYIKTNSARQKIRQWFNRQEQRINIQRGKELYSKQVRRLTTDMNLNEISKIMGTDSSDELYHLIGTGSVTVSQIAAKLTTKTTESSKPVKPIGPASGIDVLGVGDLITRIAQCCSPVWGDNISGYITRSRGVTVHRADCSNIKNENVQETLIKVDWGQAKKLYPVDIQIDAYDRVGLLKDITALVSEYRVNIANCETREVADRSIITMTLYTRGIDELNKVFSKLEGVKGVTNIIRSPDQSIVSHK
ncbi:MAG: bifunctional (p)ppGpp synthetase/guanosine-3',5'-bis(diphosphate) 3'-pyrophosphohydrolase [SAR202 cluster bacterium]|nr:bifunctional (p)ppGpp synthetase/guanosine-3',5'-bis(diphosphate) 3'-pyrophosphohydrolase [SAR202 cluster bacterium]|tara:strand:- start:88591 stop:90831 length:2241 start_codon:yes stop_codon:yes gene_type:complete